MRTRRLRSGTGRAGCTGWQHSSARGMERQTVPLQRRVSENVHGRREVGERRPTTSS